MLIYFLSLFSCIVYDRVFWSVDVLSAFSVSAPPFFPPCWLLFALTPRVSSRFAFVVVVIVRDLAFFQHRNSQFLFLFFSLMSQQFLLARRKLKTVRESVPRDDAACKRLVATFSRSSSSPTRLAFLISDALAMAAFADNGMLVCLTKPKLMEADVIWASLGEDLQEYNPVYIPKKTLEQAVVSVVSKAMADAVEAPTLDQAQQNPLNTNAAGGSAPPESIGLDNVSDPVFAGCPLVAPVCPGDPWPFGYNLRDPLPSNLSELPAHLRFYLSCMKWLFDHNEAQSVHHHPKMFQGVSAKGISDSGIELHQSASTAILTPAAGNVLRAQYVEAIKKDIDSLAFQLMDLNEPQAPVHSGGPVDMDMISKTVVAATLAASKAAASDAVSSMKTELRERILTSYRILFGRIETVESETFPGGEPRFFPADLTDEFKAVLQVQKNSEAVELFHLHLQHLTRSFGCRQAHHKDFRWDVDQFQSAGVQALRSFDWSVKHLRQYPAEASTKLTLLSFLPPASDETSAQEREAFHNEAAMVARQEGMDEDPLKASKKRTSLFLGG